MDPFISPREFLGQRCRRCGEPMAEHRLRPLHLAELPDVPAAELLCPALLMLDLGARAPAKPFVNEGR
jgi:hypothetical protein